MWVGDVVVGCVRLRIPGGLWELYWVLYGLVGCMSGVCVPLSTTLVSGLVIVWGVACMSVCVVWMCAVGICMLYSVCVVFMQVVLR